MSGQRVKGATCNIINISIPSNQVRYTVTDR